MLLSSPYFLGMGGVVTLDMGLTAWTTVAVCAFLLAVTGAGSGAAALDARSPGPAWRLPCCPRDSSASSSRPRRSSCTASLNRDWRLLARLEWARGVALFLAIAAPWFVMVSAANPEFAQFFFVHEHFERFLTKAHRREEPWWFFWPILFVGFLPWMLALVPAALEGWRRETDAIAFPWRRFALLWSAFVMLFFSASGSKLPAYILPVFPIFALVLGDWLARTPRGAALEAASSSSRPLLLIAIAAAWGMPERAKSAWTRELYAAARPWIVAGLAVLVVALAAGALRLRAGRKWTGLAIIVAGALLFIDFVEDGYERLSPRQSGKQVVADGHEAPPAPGARGCTRCATTTRRSPSTSGAPSPWSTTGTSSRRASTASPASRSRRWRTSGATGCGRGMRWL